ncbi:MAG: DoxX family protein [Rhizobiales bacterium]|nr:DoxX family protein [Hyphomicrobiales bacterium]
MSLTLKDDIAVPAPIRLLLALPGLAVVARLALASPFLTSGVTKLSDFSGATAEVAGLVGGGLGATQAGLVAAAVILVKLGGSLLFLTRRYCWLGAGLLAGFTVAATLLAHAFWAFDGPERGRQAATFFEHLAIVGGFAMAALFVNGRRTA